jgi:hypothetical protein
MIEQFKFKIGYRVKTNEAFKNDFKSEPPFSGLVSKIDYATVLGEKVPYVTIDGKKAIDQKYLEISKYE